MQQDQQVDTEKPKDFYDVRWRAWLKRELLTAKQACQLMVGVDPEFSRKWIINPSQHPELSYAQSIYKLAAKQGHSLMSPNDWREWAVASGVNPHPMFALTLHDLGVNLENEHEGDQYWLKPSSDT